MISADANPLTCRLAGALLLLLAAWQAVFSVAFGVRSGLSLALDPSGIASWVAGGVLGVGAMAAAAAIGLGSALAGAALIFRPQIGRWMGLLAAIAWTPLGCGVVGLALGVLVLYPGEARVPPALPAPGTDHG